MVSLAVLGIVLLTMNSQKSAQGELLLLDFTCRLRMHLAGAIAVTGVLLYVGGFAVGLGAVTWVLLGELLPSRVRSKTFSLFIAGTLLPRGFAVSPSCAAVAVGRELVLESAAGAVRAVDDGGAGRRPHLGIGADPAVAGGFAAGKSSRRKQLISDYC